MESQTDTYIILELLVKSLIFQRTGHHNPYFEDKCQMRLHEVITVLVKMADRTKNVLIQMQILANWKSGSFYIIGSFSRFY